MTRTDLRHIEKVLSTRNRWEELRLCKFINLCIKLNLVLIKI
jgi:hypothetical protein